MSGPQTAAEPVPARGERKRRGPKRGFWRTNVEALTVAIVMALVIKQFYFEAFQVPTESMEPTIIGRNPGGDRIIVNKFTYQLRDPERYEVVVLRYPLSRHVSYVKRVVGLPGEAVWIRYGDIYAAPAYDGTFAVTRKPFGVQDAIFRQNPAIPLEVGREMDKGGFLRWWDLPPEGRYRFAEGTLELDGGRSAALVAARPKLTYERHDPMAPSRNSTQDSGAGPANDLRIEVDVVPDPGAQQVVLFLGDCTQPDVHIRLEAVVEGAGGDTRLMFGTSMENDVAGPELRALRLPAGEETTLALENVDDMLRVIVDGEPVFTHEYEQGTDRTHIGRSSAGFGVHAGRAVFHRVDVLRDLFYTKYPGTPDAPFHVPEDHYLVFGDNSPNSLDARGWRVVGIRLRDDGLVLLGDREAVSDEFDAPRRPSNPWFDPEEPEVHKFLDLYGNHWELEPGSYDLLDLGAFENRRGVGILELHRRHLPELPEEKLAIPRLGTETVRNQTSPHHQGALFRPYTRLVHYVPRPDIVGRAYLVFWPPDRAGAIR